MEKVSFSVHNKQNQGGKSPQTNKKQRKSLELQQMPQKYCFIRETQVYIQHTEPKMERVVDECPPPPPHPTSQCEINLHIGEQAFIPVSLQNIKNTLEGRIKHKILQ